MADSVLKVKPVKDLLDEILDDVQPIITYSIGDTILEFWKPDHISEKHHLRLVAVQVEQMVVGRQYQNLLTQLNQLSERTDMDAGLQALINGVSQQFSEKGEELFPLSCQYLEALSEREPGELMTIIITALEKRSVRKELPLKLFVNSLAEKVRTALQPVEDEQAALMTSDEDEEDLEDSPLEVLPPAEENGHRQLKASEKPLTSTSAT